nr:integrase, catalytic region, zinc finger, CCHC-type, peptidase aspartic, catalytic [Tanacetum cinerariifolium]
MSHVKPNRISPAKGDTKLPIDDKPRKNKSHLRTSTRTDSSSRLKRTVINSHSASVCQTCAKCVTLSNHDLCVATCLQSAMATPSIHHNRSVERKVKQVWKPKHVRQVWKPTGKVLTTFGHQWRPTGRIFDLGNQCPLTKFTPPKVGSFTQHTRRTSPCANQKEPHQNWGSNLSNADRMADVSAPSDQTPTMAPPVRKKRATLIVIPSVRFTKLIIHHLQRKHRFYPRPDSPLHLSNEEPVLEYLKFSAKGTKREIFGMPIPGRLITANIRAAPYYQEYQENVAKHRGFLAGETRSTQDLHVPRPAKPARKPQSTAQKAPSKPSISSPVTSTQPAPTSVPAKIQEHKHKQASGTTDKPAKAKRIKRSVSRNTRQSKGSPKSVGASEAKEVPAEEPQVAEEDADFLKAVEESMKDAYALPKGQLPPVVIREPELGKYQPLPEVPGKGKEKVFEEQVSHDLLSLQKHKKTSHADQYIFQRRVSKPTASSFHDVSSYEVLGQSDSEEESKKVVLGVEKGSQDEDQAGPDLNAQAEG